MTNALHCARPADAPAGSGGLLRGNPYGCARVLRAARARRAAAARRDWERMLLEAVSSTGRRRTSERWREMKERLEELRESLKPLEDELQRLQLLPPHPEAEVCAEEPAETLQAGFQPQAGLPCSAVWAFAALELHADLNRIAGEQADGVLALRQALRRQQLRQRLAVLRAAAAASRGIYTMPPAASAALSLLA